MSINISYAIVSPEPIVLPSPPNSWFINGTSNDPLIKLLDKSTEISLQAYWNDIVHETNITSFANKVIIYDNYF